MAVDDAVQYLYENIGLEVVVSDKAAQYLYENVGLAVPESNQAAQYLYENIGLAVPESNKNAQYLYQNVLATGGGVLKANAGSLAVPDWRNVGCGSSPQPGRFKLLVTPAQATANGIAAGWWTEKCDTDIISIISDNFNRINSATTPNPTSDGGTWTVQSGVWGITNNKLQLQSMTVGTKFDGMAPLTRNTFRNAADLTVVVNRASEVNGGSSMLLVGFNGASSCYAWQFNSSGFSRLLRFTGFNTFSTLGTPASGSFTGIDTLMRLTHDGAGVLKTYKNGVLLGTYTDSTPLTGTEVGVGEYLDTANVVTTFDDFSATAAIATRPLNLLDNGVWKQVACMVPPPPPPAPASIVSSGTSQSNTTGTPSITLTGIQAGDMLVWITGQDVDGPSGFTKRQDFNDPGPNNHLEVWTKTAVGGESVITSVSQPWHLALAYCFRSVAYDTSAISTMSVAATSKITPSVTAATAGSVVLHIWKARKDSSGVSITPPGALLNQLLANAFGTIAVTAGWEILPAGTTPGQTANSGANAQDWISAVLVLRN